MKRTPNRTLTALLATALLLVFAGQSLAAGTEADVTISNTANVTFTIGGGTPPPVNSNTVTFEVDRKINVVVANTLTNVDVVPSQTDNVLAFSVTNLSNTAAADTDYFYLRTSNGSGDDFDMSAVKIYVDTNGNGALDTGESELTGDNLVVTIAVDATANYLVIANAPDNSVITATGQTADVHLYATAWSGATVAAGVLAEDSDGNDPAASEIFFADAAGSLGAGTDDAGDGLHSAVGTYVANWTNLGVTKGQTSATGYHIPGDTVTYTITVTNSDTADDATGVIISDPIPANTAYVASSLDCSGLTGSSAQVNSAAGWTAEASASGNITAVRCTGGTIVKNDGTNDGEGTMSFQVTIN